MTYYDLLFGKRSRDIPEVRKPKNRSVQSTQLYSEWDLKSMTERGTNSLQFERLNPLEKSIQKFSPHIAS